jgi:hypothetical protein
MNTHTRGLHMASFALLSGLILLLAYGLSQITEFPALALPLDDVYIHFQYARALAEGHPYQYMAGEPASSGATSFLYPYLLAAGYWLGAKGDSLRWWALAIGVFSWVGSVWLVYWLLWKNSTAKPLVGAGLALMGALAFVLQGGLLWAFVSGMETGLFIFACLLSLAMLSTGKLRAALYAGALTALVRPEGAVIGLGVLLYAFWQGRKNLRGLVAPTLLLMLAVLTQPLLNLALTGTVSASGLQAKSYLYNMPPNLGQSLAQTAATAGQIWQRLLADPPDRNPLQPLYLTGPITVAGVLALLWGIGQLLRRRIRLVMVVGLWLAGITALTSVLETAFWQMKRYQQPMVALLLVLAGWLGQGLWGWASQQTQKQTRWVGRGLSIGLMLLLLAASALTTTPFGAFYTRNRAEVEGSQAYMAEIARDLLPAGAVVGVHDIGVMAYVGGLRTYDVVGLTTAGAAAAWRQGPGAVYETMLAAANRPDYFAIYPDARGLTYFADSGLFGEVLGRFPSLIDWNYNVASAMPNGQTLYRADWSAAAAAGSPQQPSTLAALTGFTLVDSLNNASLASEQAHQYRWWQADARAGFATEMYRLPYTACQTDSCVVMDGGRLLSGGEAFKVVSRPGQDLLWVIRVHARHRLLLRLYANDQLVGVRLVPAIPGTWLEIASLVPANLISQTNTRLQVEVESNDPSGYYMPYQQWFYAGNYPQQPPTEALLATFAAATEPATPLIALKKADLSQTSATLSLELTWQLLNSAPQDSVLFVHLYDDQGKLREDVQFDGRPSGGTLPLANWLPAPFGQQIQLALPATLPAGTYQVAIGLYDAESFVRMRPNGKGADAEGRLFIGEIAISWP